MGCYIAAQARPYLCKKLDLSARVALVRPADVKYYTKVADYQDVHVTGGKCAYPLASSLGAPNTSVTCASATVTLKFLGFHRVWHGSGKVFDSVQLFLPDSQFETKVRQNKSAQK